MTLNIFLNLTFLLCKIGKTPILSPMSWIQDGGFWISDKEGVYLKEYIEG